MIIVKIRNSFYYLVEFTSSGILTTSVSPEFALQTSIKHSTNTFQLLRELYDESNMNKLKLEANY